MMHGQPLKFTIVYLVVIIAISSCVDDYSKSTRQDKLQEAKIPNLDYKLGKFKSARKAKLTFTYQGEEHAEKIIKFTIIGTTYGVLNKYTGLNITQTAKEEEIVNIHINAKAEALPIEYSGKEIRYTVLSVTGTILLENKGIVIEKSFEGESSRLDHLIIEPDKYIKPSDIFFDPKLPDMLEHALKGQNIFQESNCYYSKLYEVTAEAFGPENIIPALESKDSRFASLALNSLLSIHGPETLERMLPLVISDDKKRSSPATRVIGMIVFINLPDLHESTMNDAKMLIRALNHNNERVRAIATKGVREIAKGRFKNDIQRWRKWWSENGSIISNNIYNDYKIK